MNIDELKKLGVPDFVIERYKEKNIVKLNPAQIKAVNAGIFDGKSMLVCTPTGSGKTAIATFAITKRLGKGTKAIYLVPLKALASEKYNEYTELFKNTEFKVAVSTGDLDSSSKWLGNYDLLILTTEKMDSLIRHHCPWLTDICCVVIDEIHLLNDPERGPTLEILITLLKKLLKNIQIIALSATIGNPEELASWLGAELVKDDWRPVKLYKGVYLDEEVEFE